MEYKLAPSILAADFMRLGEQIDAIAKAGAQYVHYDVMDGIYVPSISFGLPVLKSVRKGTDLFLDCHLMIMDPDRYIDEFADCGADSVTVHVLQRLPPRIPFPRTLSVRCIIFRPSRRGADIRMSEAISTHSVSPSTRCSRDRFPSRETIPYRLRCSISRARLLRYSS